MPAKIKVLIAISVLLVCVAAVFISARFFSGEDGWVCQDGQWVKHGVPANPMPVEPCGEGGGLVRVFKPEANALVTSPLVVTGEARGMWFFEASFPIKLLDAQGETMALGIATAQGDWMTEDFVPFTAELQYFSFQDQTGTLVLMKDNPSGLPENDAEIIIPVRLTKTEGTQLSLFFGNTAQNPDLQDCQLVYAAQRVVPATSAVARAALEELFKGPTEEEKNAGFFTSIPDGVKIQKLIIENGVAMVDLSAELDRGIGGSCRVLAIRSQIERTLKQFSSVNSVVLSIDGRTEDILQP